MGLNKYYILETHGEGRTEPGPVTARHLGGKAIPYLRNGIEREIGRLDVASQLATYERWRVHLATAPRPWRKKLLHFWAFYRDTPFPLRKMTLRQFTERTLKGSKYVRYWRG